ncbi:hypothetical protein M501DRAFT_925941 [Patellaria atrata CBS 101060]|uniref:Uncharacterized protein n=1 Tax=Patellaria atrata CBS 101060 TaxID=1346257 RepID=A0A9P4VTF5_9PEZI|nr:hypothetical protein M501DRAFT_925941 [Patellaria atrata CBS 101060]
MSQNEDISQTVPQVNSESETQTVKPITLRPPLASPYSQPLDLNPPTPQWLEATWHVTHSSLPMWKSKRNVRITYKILDSDATPKLDDMVTYQALNGKKVKNVHGIDTPVSTSGVGDGWAYNWRGVGWLKIASSHWEVIGYGNDNGAAEEGVEGENGYIVTYFAKTLFTPAGIDICCRNPEGVSKAVLEGIKRALREAEDENIRKLAGEVFEVKRDGARED